MIEENNFPTMPERNLQGVRGVVDAAASAAAQGLDHNLLRRSAAAGERKHRCATGMVDPRRGGFQEGSLDIVIAIRSVCCMLREMLGECYGWMHCLEMPEGV